MFLLATLFVTLTTTSVLAQQQQRRSFIRDAEVENTIRAYSAPLFQAAGLSPEAVRLHLIVDNSLNAFVAGGQNMFFHTGLLIRSESANQLIGVMAHETGHIAGGHLARLQDAAGNAGTEALVAMLLGAAVGVASGRGDVGTAIALGGQDMALKNLLTYSRMEESSADQAAVSYLDATRQSAKGLLEFFEVLGDQELLVTTRQDPYVRTHPLTRDRVNFIRDYLARSPYTNVQPRPEFVEMHRRMRAKLFAFLEPPTRTLQRYKESDAAIEARYARAIAYYRKPELDKALALIDDLIKERPDDPYFHELKGQMLFENGHGADSVAPYRKSVELLPDNALLKIGLAQSLIEQDDPVLLQEAQQLLSLATHQEPKNLTAWRLLSVAHGRDGDEGMAAYAMAEQAMLENRITDANFLAGKAERLLPKTGPVWLRIQDIKEQTNLAKPDDDKRRR